MFAECYLCIKSNFILWLQHMFDVLLSQIKVDMKQVAFAILTVLFGSFASYSQCSELFFSEYLEGSSNNKALEIYNPTSTAINLVDYKLYRYNNGSPIPSDSLFPVGIIVPGDVFVMGNPTAVASILAVSDTLHTITFFNGDDAISLVKISTNTVLDVIGQIGVDPGVNWVVGSGATSEFTLTRMANIQQGVGNWTIGATQWNVFPQNMLDSLGGHYMISCGSPCTNTASTITEAACETYLAPDGMQYTTSGTYTATIPNVAGCDSVVTINLTINEATTSLITASVCDSYDLNGTIYNFTGVYYQTLTNSIGCDSVITLDLEVTPVPSVPVIVGELSYCEGDTPTALSVGASGPIEPLIISGIADATLSGGLPKVVEFYVIEDISDLSAFGFGSANNGLGSNGQEFTFPAVAVTAGSYIHVATDSVNTFNFFGFYPDYTDPVAGNVNGDDAIELFHNGAVIDVFGDINVDGTGQAWEYLDGWAYRFNNAVPNGGVFNVGEWFYSGIDALDGALTNMTASNPMPVETYTYVEQTLNYVWYDEPTLTNIVGTGATYTPVTTTGTTTYYVTASGIVNTACVSMPAQATVVFNALPSATITAVGTVLTADLSGATYQWIDCSNNSPIAGATNQSFTATVNGNYAVEVSENGCSATSACESINFIGISELNPSEKQVLKIVDLTGRETNFTTNQPLIYIYTDGSTERVYVIEE